MCFPEGKPFVKLLSANPVFFAQPLYGSRSGKVFSEDPEDKEEAVAGIRNEDIR